MSSVHAVDWPSYDRWNAAIADEFFAGRYGGHPVYLDLEDDALARIAGAAVGDDVQDPRAGLIDAVRPTLYLVPRMSIFRAHRRRLRNWRLRGGEGPPPIIAVLALLSLIAEQMTRDTDFSASNYYGRFLRTLGYSATDRHLRQKVVRCFAEESHILWDGLNSWLAERPDLRGRPTAHAFDFRVHVGVPMSQALVRDADRAALHELFVDYRLSPGQQIPHADMVRLLREWLPLSPVSSVLKQFAGHEEALLRVADVACVELEAWEGGATVSVVGSRHRLAFVAGYRRHPRPRLSLGLAVRVGRAEARELMLAEGAGVAAREALAGAGGRLGLAEPDEEGWADVTDASGVSMAHALVALLELRGSDLRLRRVPRRLVVLERDEERRRFVEVERVRLGDEYLLLAADTLGSLLDEALAEAARPGWTPHEAGTVAGVPTGWRLYTGVEVVGITSSRQIDLAPLIPIAWTQLTVSGGLALPGRGAWLTSAAPEVSASSLAGDPVLAVLTKDTLPLAAEEDAADQDVDAVLQDDEHEPDTPLSEHSTSTPRHPWTTRAWHRARRPRSKRTPGCWPDSDLTQRSWAASTLRPSSRLPTLSSVTDAIASRWSRPTVQPRHWLRDPQPALPGPASSDRVRAGSPVGAARPRRPECRDIRRRHPGSAHPRSDRQYRADPRRRAWPWLGSLAGGRRRCSRGGRATSRGLAQRDLVADVHGDRRALLQAAAHDESKGQREIHAVCEHCGVERFFPARPRRRGFGSKRSTRAERLAHAATLPVLPARPADTERVDLDRLLEATCVLGSGDWRSLERLTDQMDDSPWAAVEAARTLSSLGHLDVMLDRYLRPARWSISPATIVESATGAFLAGWRSDVLLDQLGRIAVELGGRVVWQPAPGAPTVIRINDLAQDDLERLASRLSSALEIAVAVAPDAPRLLAAQLPSLATLRAALREVPAAIGERIERFDPNTGRWTTDFQLGAPGGYRTARLPRRFWHFDGTDWRVSDNRLVKWLSATPRQRMVAYDPESRGLACHLGAQLPGLYERAAVLGSGEPPSRPTPDTSSIAAWGRPSPARSPGPSLPTPGRPRMCPQSLDPLQLHEAIKDAYLRYYDTAYWLRDETLRDERRALLEADGVVFREPLIEPVLPYESTDSIAEACAAAGCTPGDRRPTSAPCSSARTAASGFAPIRPTRCEHRSAPARRRAQRRRHLGNRLRQDRVVPAARLRAACSRRR